MPSKNISIDLDVYLLLRSQKKGGESFSMVIKRLIPEPFDFKKWIEEMDADPLSDKTIASIEQVMDHRRRPRKIPKGPIAVLKRLRRCWVSDANVLPGLPL